MKYFSICINVTIHHYCIVVTVRILIAGDFRWNFMINDDFIHLLLKYSSLYGERMTYYDLLWRGNNSVLRWALFLFLHFESSSCVFITFVTHIVGMDADVSRDENVWFFGGGIILCCILFLRCSWRKLGFIFIVGWMWSTT